MSEKSNKLPKVEYVTITPELAREWIGGRMFERQRDVRPGAVRQYVKMMEGGEWQPWTVIQFTENGTGLPVITDGQHRLLAVEASGIPIQAIIITYPGGEFSSIVERYIHTDKGRSRSTLDTAIALGMPERFDVSKSLVGKAWNAVTIISESFGPGTKKGTRLESTVIKLLEEGYLEIAKVYSELVGTQYHSGFYRASVMAVGLYTLKYASQVIEERQVREFWHGAAHGIGEDPNDPRRRLHDHAKEGLYASARSKQEVVSKVYSIYFTAKCWNASLGGTLIKQRQVSTNKALAIEATPLGKELKAEDQVGE